VQASASAGRSRSMEAASYAPRSRSLPAALRPFPQPPPSSLQHSPSLLAQSMSASGLSDLDKSWAGSDDDRCDGGGGAQRSTQCDSDLADLADSDAYDHNDDDVLDDPLRGDDLLRLSGAAAASSAAFGDDFGDLGLGLSDEEEFDVTVDSRATVASGAGAVAVPVARAATAATAATVATVAVAAVETVAVVREAVETARRPVLDDASRRYDWYNDDTGESVWARPSALDPQPRQTTSASPRPGEQAVAQAHAAFPPAPLAMSPAMAPRAQHLQRQVTPRAHAGSVHSPWASSASAASSTSVAAAPGDPEVLRLKVELEALRRTLEEAEKKR